jgi:hypothetical protein
LEHWVPQLHVEGRAETFLPARNVATPPPAMVTADW